MPRKFRCRNCASPTSISRRMRSSGGSGPVAPSEMREVMRQRFDLFLAQGVGHIRHRRHGAAGSYARLVVTQSLDEVFLALAGDAGDGLGTGIGIGMAGGAAPADRRLRALRR